MLYFLAGLLVGSTFIVLIMSLMMAAKNGDQQLEKFYNQNLN
ncbi:DUF3789 domain-containing protein [Neobacillus sp. Marseille-QA0830]